MSSLQNENENTTRMPIWLVASGLVLSLVVLGLVVVVLMRPETKAKSRPVNEDANQENHMAAAKLAVGNQRDLGSCRQAISHLDKDRMTRAHEIQQTAPSSEIPASIRERFADYLRSVTSPGMDAWYLEQCLIFREIITAGDFQPVSKDPMVSLRATKALWDWVMREVALQESSNESAIKAPLHWILRRGTGTAEERACVFLAMLRHAGISGTTGCLIRFTSAESPFKLLVGTRGPDGKLNCFDPVLGLSLDKSKVPNLSRWLETGWADPDWTGKSTGKAESKRHWETATVGITVQMQALAPRNDDLVGLKQEDSFAVPKVDISKEIKDWKESFRSIGLPDALVGCDLPFLVRWHSFLPPSEGGEGKPGLVQLFSFSYVPWDLLPREILQAHPLLASIPAKQQMGMPIPQPVGERLLFGVFAPVFRNWHETTDKGRDLLLRFQFSRLVPELKQEKDEIQARVGKMFNAEEKAFLRQWIEQANTDYAQLARNPGNPTAEDSIKALWERSGPMLMTVLIPAANSRLEEIQVALVLAKHEQAAHLERKLAKKSMGTSQADVTRAWRSAADGWAQLASESHFLPPARALLARYQGEALSHAGNRTKANEIWKLNAGDDSAEARACKILSNAD